MIINKASRVGCGQTSKVWLRVVREDSAGPRQRGVKKSFIENAGMPSVFSEGFQAHEDQRPRVKPFRPPRPLVFFISPGPATCRDTWP